ncbi:DUF4350 domain-containing protein [Chloroflexota bacterium]
MRISNILFVVAIVIVVISLVCIWFYPSIEDFMSSNTMWNGIRDFSEEFNANNIESINDATDSPKDSVLVAIPYLDYTDEELSTIRRFLEGGGSLLLMDDYGYGNTILTYLGVDIRFTNKPLLDPLFCYKNQWLPRITDFDPKIKESGVNAITLNHATTLTNTTRQEVIAWSSDTSYLDLNENMVWDDDEPKGPLPVATELRIGKGKIILVSDPSILISSMVNQDNNYDFIKYLVRNDNEEKEILFANSHLTKTPLDVSKIRLVNTREALSSPYALLGITAMVFVVVSRYTLKRGGNIG